MPFSLSANTQAILLLTAPLIAGRGSASSSELLTPGEYKRLARHLRDRNRQPADLLTPDSAPLLQACQEVIDEGRLRRLLSRGFLLGQVIEHWRTRAIWVVSRADPDYPRRLKFHLREDTPPLLYGCGDQALLEYGGLAVVGSRHIDDDITNYARMTGSLAARSNRVIISGGAKGVDQAAMQGSLQAGGTVIGVLSDSLEKAAMNREYRDLLLAGRLVLVSPYDPAAGFNVGNAMQRNKLIYALSNAALVVSSDLNKGGTWAGAIEQLDKFGFVPVFVRATPQVSPGLDALRQKGALIWPDPQDQDAFEATLSTTSSAIVPQAISENKLDEENPVALYDQFRNGLPTGLTEPFTLSQAATALKIPEKQVKPVLERLVTEGVLEKLKKPVRYAQKPRTLL